MAAITTILATLASVGETFVSGWLESRGDQIISNTPGFAKRVIAQFHDTKIPVNNDLQKAITSSHWLATKVFCEKLKKNNPSDIFESILRVVKERLAQINQKGYLLTEKDKPDDFEAELLILKENGKEAPGILKNKVVDYHLKELKSLLKEREADSTSYETFEKAIRNGLADENLDWFDLVCAFLNELLKVDSRAKDTFQNEELAKIGLAINDLGELKKTLETITNGSVEKIGEERFGELKSLVHDELEEIKVQLGEIKKGIDEVNDTAKEIHKIVTKVEKDLSKINPSPPFAQKLTPIPELGTFIGRNEDLEELSQTLATANQVVLMNGMGGIGKTTLARAYVNKNLSVFNHVAWISVTEDNIKDAFVNTIYFDKDLKEAQLSEGDNKSCFIAIMRAFNNLQGKGLLVIDNAEKDAEEIKHLLPPPPQWQILLTSRLELKAFKEIRLDKLSPEYAEEVFKEYYGKPIKEQDYPIFLSLLKEIDYHTLTIELVAKTMRESDNNLKFAEVLEKLKQRQLDDRRMHELIHVRHFDDNKAVLYNHLLATFNLSQLTEYEIWVLKQFTALPPEPILKDTLIEWLELDENKSIDFEQVLKTLRNKGWLKRTEHAEGNVQYTIHRLIQNMVHYQYGINFADVESLIITFQRIISFDENTNFSQKFQYLSTIEFLLKSLPENLENATMAFLYNNLGIIYKQFVDLNRAEKNLSKALEIYKKQNDENNIATCQSNLGMVYRELGYHKQAKNLLELTLESDIRIFGSNHPNVAISQSNLAMINQDLGNSKTAKELLESALQINIDFFGLESTNVAIVQSNLGLVYKDLGDFKRAKELLEIALQNLEHGHPSTARIQSNLAMIYKALGSFERAKELLELSLETTIIDFGLTHLDTARTQWNLATVLVDLKDFSRVEQLSQSAYETFKYNLGVNHMNTRRCLNWLNYIRRIINK